MKPPFGTERFSLLKGNKGSAFVQALIAVGVVGVMLYFLSPEVIKHRQQVTKTSSIITARLAMHSMVDFTLLGIRQRWCFSTDWMPENCGSSSTATTAEMLSHPRSVERLLMKQETVSFLKTLGVPNADNVPLERFSQTINVKSFSAMHPIYKMIAELKGYKVESIFVQIERNNNGSIPMYGRELYLKVTVRLLDSSGNIIQVGSSKLQTVSQVGVYPREVGSFALLVASDLYLDRSKGVGLKKGDSYVQNFSSRTERLKYTGLVFESPVFVNGSVHLPVAPSLENDKKGQDTNYTPVVFKDKIVLGTGPIMRRGQPFMPRSAGDLSDQFWANVRQFGGFKKGVEIDGERDLGLDYLSGLVTGNTTIDPDLMNKCIDRNKRKFDLSYTANSQLVGQMIKQSGNKTQTRMALTDQNSFNPQTGEVSEPSLLRTGLFGEILKHFDIDKKEGAIARYVMNFGKMQVQGEIPDNGTVTLEPEINLTALKKEIDNKISAASSQLLIEQSKLKDINAQIDVEQAGVDDLKNAIERERQKNPVDKDKVRRLQDSLDTREDNLRRAKRELVRQKQTIDEAQNKVDALEKQKAAVIAQEGIQPKIQISIQRPVDPNDPKKNTNPSFRDLEITMENPELFLNGDGRPMDLALQLEAYDVSYYKGSSLRTWSSGQTPGNRGFLYFRNTGRGSFDISRSMTYFENGPSKGGLPDMRDIYTDYEGLCATTSSSAFGSTDWSKSFASTSQHSWSFTRKYDDAQVPPNITFDSSNAYRSPGGGGTATFRVGSIQKVCTIEASANFVTGFLNCEILDIKPRASELRIIGSIIVTKGLKIDKSAYDYGIRWSTIYHPMATYELRQAGVLKALNAPNCASIARFPVWHPHPSMTDLANLYRCNAVSLRSKADPFRWTSVDPDCGLMTGSNSTMCKNRLVHFYVIEISRESGI